MSAVERLIAVARASSALDLRTARLIAWFKRQDLRSIGHASYRTFAATRLDWCDSWMRALVRLVESPLERVKSAVCQGRIPLRLAVRAPSETTPDDEENWLRYAVDVPHKPRREPTVDLSGEVLVTIAAARELARVNLGWPAPDVVADREIRRQWARHDAAATQRDAHATPEPPAPLPPWCDADDPATGLLGPWVEPTSLDDGLRQLDEVLTHRRLRVPEMGFLYREVQRERLWEQGYASLSEMIAACRLDRRTLERAQALVVSLDDLPDTTAALDCGEITLDEARRIASVATEDTEEALLRIVPWYTRPDFARLVELAAHGVPILAEAERVIDMLLPALDLSDLVTFGGLRRQMPAPRHASVHPDLPAAAAWYLANAAPSPHREYAEAKAADRECCREPHCRTGTRRLHTHHIDPRALGGGDEATNLLNVCFPDHMRGPHGGAFTVKRIGCFLVWRYPGWKVVEAA